MEHLTSRDTRRLFEFLRDLYELRDYGGFKQHVVRGIADLVSADLYAYNEISTDRKLVTGYAIWPTKFPLLKDAPEIVGRYQHQHPPVAHYLTTGNGDVTKISDFMTYRQFRRTDLHNEFYRPMGIPYGIGFGITLAQDGLIGIGLHRNGKDYSERDRRILSELHPHIRQAYENAQTVTRMRRGAAVLYGALDALDLAVVCVSQQSRIRWATPRANRLLQEYGLVAPRARTRLHTTVSDQMKLWDSHLLSPRNISSAPQPLTIQGVPGRLVIRPIQQEQERLLILDEVRRFPTGASMAQLGLSARETEILKWVVEGKTNPEIGTILGISPRTVQKHLERIYTRLGVENRHAAMRMVLDADSWQKRTNDSDF